ncbi:MAG: hypothetical protein JXA46_06960 [Dehalococcoidales bacterium]|nr:hypothetical protein [Dehalococcoidales bacterium]
MSKTSDAMVSDLVGTFTDPIIVYPGGWGDTLPGWLKEAITLERLETNIKTLNKDEPTGTNAEACAYLYTAGLTAPMDSDWSQIYLYVATITYARHKGNQVPDDIRVESLTDYQMGELGRLKSWLFQHRIKARQDKDRAERRQVKEDTAAQKEAEKPMLFQF